MRSFSFKGILKGHFLSKKIDGGKAKLFKGFVERKTQNSNTHPSENFELKFKSRKESKIT